MNPTAVRTMPDAPATVKPKRGSPRAGCEPTRGLMTMYPSD